MRTKLLVWTILLSFPAIPAYGQDQHASLVQELYVKSGMEKQLEQLPLVIQAAIDEAVQKDENLNKLPNNVSSAIKGQAGQAFAVNSTKGVLIQELGPGLTDRELKEILAWLDSPNGKKCTQLEEAASTPEAYAEMQQYGAQIRKSPPSAERLQALGKLDAAAKITQSSVQAAIGLQTAVTLALNATLPLEKQMSPEDISREMDKIKPAIESAARSQTLIQLVYTYRSLTLDEIDEYIQFAVSPAGAKYQDVSAAAMQKVILAGGIRWGKAVGQALEQAKNQSGA